MDITRFLHMDPLDEMQIPTLDENPVVDNASISPKPLWEFESVSYLETVEPSWLDGNSYLCSATDFTSSSVVTTSPCVSPDLPSSSAAPTSSPWKMFVSSDVSASVVSRHSQAERPSLSFSVDSTGESDLPFRSTNAIGAIFEFLPPEAIWDNDNCSRIRHLSTPSNDLLNSSHDNAGKQPLVTLAHFQPAPSVSFGLSRHAQRKGLSGWGDTTNLKVYNQEALLPSLNNSHRISQSASTPKSNADRDTVLSSLSLETDSLGTPPRQDSKRTRHEFALRHTPRYPKADTCDFLTEDDPARHSDRDDSDDYRPSCSPSPSPPASPLPDSLKRSRPVSTMVRRGRTSNSKRSKQTGSAALALAVVTQVSEARRESQSRQQPDLDHDWFDPVRVYRGGSYKVKKRKNQSIPVPVPVPDLNKKSRGRKVPFIPVISTSGVPVNAPGTVTLSKTEEGSIEGINRACRTRRKCNSASTPSMDDLAGSRTFVCVVPGCGKCFVRGEHLKRHVRSIHTHDKPHVCPFDGCDKSFSRRDNLGQHVRLHLQQ